MAPFLSPFLPNLLRPHLLRPEEASRRADISCPVHREAPIQGYCNRAFDDCYSWSFSIVCTYKKRRTDIRVHSSLSNTANPLGKIHTNTEQICSSKGHSNPSQCTYITYKPNYVHRRISPHIGRTAYASEEEIVQNSIMIFIYHNMMYMSIVNIYNILYCVGGR